MSNVYLDNNATTKLLPSVMQTMNEVASYPLNPSSVHAMGQRARKLVEDARSIIKNKFNAPHAGVIFTSCGTEANNLAMKGVLSNNIFVSAIEHVSVLKARNDVMVIPVSNNGVVDIAALERLLKTVGGKALISVMYVNNETGVIQPIEEIVRLARSFGAYVHSDVSQACGKIIVDVAKLGVDLLTISAHKFGGPQGISALLICNNSIDLKAQISGGGQEKNKRAGTENVAAIAGFGVAVSEIDTYINKMQEKAVLRDYMEEKIINLSKGKVVIFGKENKRIPNTSCLAMSGVDAQTQVVRFDLRKIAISSGSACSSGKVARSHVLSAMGCDDKLSSSAIRVSMGIDTNHKEIDFFIDNWVEIYNSLANNSQDSNNKQQAA